MRTTGFMVFAPVFLSDVGEDFLSAATFAPAYFGTFPFRRKTLLRTRSFDAHSGRHPPPGYEEHIATRLRTAGSLPFRGDHAGKPNSARRPNSTRRRSTVPCGTQSKRQ